MAIRELDLRRELVLPPRSRRRRVAARVRPSRVRAHVAQHGKRYALAVPAWMIRGYQHANAADLAAAVAFNALVAFVPTVLLLISLGGLLLQRDQVLINVIYSVLWALPRDQVQPALETVLKARSNSGWFAVLSLIGFAWIGTNFVSCLARSMNRIYGVRNCGFACEKRRGFLVILAFSVLFILASIAAILPSLFVAKDLPYYFETWLLADGRVQILGYGVAILSAMALFAVLYRVVPNAGQHAADIWPGIVTAGLLFVLLAQVFPIYLRMVGNYNQYGQAFGFVTLLVTWFYLLAHVVLFGTYVNATYQHQRRCRRIGSAARVMARTRSAVRVLQRNRRAA